MITEDLINVKDDSTLALEFQNVGRTTLHKIVSENLQFQKMYTCWIPRLLTEEYQMKRMVYSLDILDRYYKDGDQFLEKIVTGDETWVSHMTPKLNVSQWNGITRHFKSESRRREQGQSQLARLRQPCFGLDMGSLLS